MDANILRHGIQPELPFSERQFDPANVPDPIEGALALALGATTIAELSTISEENIPIAIMDGEMSLELSPADLAFSEAYDTLTEQLQAMDWYDRPDRLDGKYAVLQSESGGDYSQITVYRIGGIPIAEGSIGNCEGSTAPRYIWFKTSDLEALLAAIAQG